MNAILYAELFHQQPKQDDDRPKKHGKSGWLGGDSLKGLISVAKKHEDGKQLCQSPKWLLFSGRGRMWNMQNLEWRNSVQ